MKPFEKEIIRHCSPTLAGIKTGNLFSYPYDDYGHLHNQILDWNAALNPRGVFITILKVNINRVLIYFYRKNRLENDLSCPMVKRFLEHLGYSMRNLDSCLSHLSSRIQNCTDFPHEIGLFLSYPFEDVLGFINHEGIICKYCGCWKVYTDEHKKIKLFNKYKKCTRKYYQCLIRGTSILNLYPETHCCSIKP